MTNKPRRQAAISNAILNHDLNKLNWFCEINGMIKFDLSNCKSDRQKAGVIVEWVKSCEEYKSEVTKEEIMKRYNV